MSSLITQDISVELILCGPLAGRSCRLGNMDFVKGVGKFTGKAWEVEGRALVMGRMYQAFIKGSKEHQAWERKYGVRDQVRETESYGLGSGSADELQRRSPARHGPEQTGRLQNETELQRRSDEGRGQGFDVGLPRVGLAADDAHGDGQESTGHGAQTDATDNEEDSLSPRELLGRAVKALDANNDDHWTPAGAPSLMALSELVQNPKLTRAEVSQFGWTRTQAITAQNQAR